MGVDFHVPEVKWEKSSQGKSELPRVQVHFAATEYPRFLSQLAADAELGEVWKNYRDAGDDPPRSPGHGGNLSSADQHLIGGNPAEQYTVPIGIAPGNIESQCTHIVAVIGATEWSFELA